ncbi:inner nuclear membrane protein enriched at telomere/subtelomere region [Thoreauomyces humboldtii]|nr:inner nuclear membrane protein enriched at telomere/subtelomere region [Thoreauomyces humboldtii]
MASGSDAEPAWLEPGFDSSSLKISQLRSILGKNDVVVPGSAKKKAELVALFEKELTPRKNAIKKELKKNYGPPPKTFGIPQDSGIGSSAGPSSAAATPAPTRKGRKAAPVPVVPDAEPGSPERPESIHTDPVSPDMSTDNPFQTGSGDVVEPKSAKKKLTKRRVSELPPSSSSSGRDTDTIVPKRRARQSVGGALATGRTLSKKPVEVDLIEVESDDAVDNPIIPATVSRKTTRRQTLGGDTVVTPIKKALVKRKSLAVLESYSSDDAKDDSADDELDVKTTATAPIRFINLQPLSPVAATKYSDDVPTSIPPPFNSELSTGDSWSTVTPGTPQISATTPTATTAPISPRKFKRPNTFAPAKTSKWLQFVWAVVVVLGGLVGHWYYEAREILEFCDPNIPHHGRLYAKSYDGYNPLVGVLPTCFACPKNGVCAEQTVLSCEPADYILRGNRIASVVPLPFPFGQPTCVKDTRQEQEELKRQQHIETLRTMLETTVRTWIGNAECGVIPPESIRYLRNGPKGDVTGMPLQLAEETIRRTIGRKWPDDKFKNYWSQTVKAIRNENGSIGNQHHHDHHQDPTHAHHHQPAVSEIMDPTGSTRLYTTRDPPIMPLPCRLRRGIWSTCRTYWMQLSALGITLLFCVWFTHQRRHAAHDARVVESLVEDITDVLVAEADHNATDPVRHPIPGVPVRQLQDYYLPSSRAMVKGAKEGDAVEDPETGGTRFMIGDESRRLAIWDTVERIVLRNSSVRDTVMDVKGDSVFVWQWIGSHSLSPRARTAKAEDVVASGAGGGVGHRSKKEGAKGKGSDQDDGAKVDETSTIAVPTVTSAAPLTASEIYPESD